MFRFVFIIGILFTVASSGFGENLEDVIYLKDGSVVRGIIVEQIPGTTVTIQTAGGSEFVYKMDHVAKIAKELRGRRIGDIKWAFYGGAGFRGHPGDNAMDETTEGGIIATVAFGFHTTRTFEIGLSISYSNASAAEEKYGDVRILQVIGYGRLFFSAESAFRPYFAIGGGIDDLSTGATTSTAYINSIPITVTTPGTSATELVGRLGTGITYFPPSGLGLFLEVGYGTIATEGKSTPLVEIIVGIVLGLK